MKRAASLHCVRLNFLIENLRFPARQQPLLLRSGSETLIFKHFHAKTVKCSTFPS